MKNQDFVRYAVYYVPPIDADWRHFATAWLGWDAINAISVEHPYIPFLQSKIARMSFVPRKYGLHATIKSPFRLVSGMSLDDMHVACKVFCAMQSPIFFYGLRLEQLNGFLTLQPEGDISLLNNLAASCIEMLDDFRAPATHSELTCFRARSLSTTQEMNLIRWGYPYVMEDFCYHITLTGCLSGIDLSAARAALDMYLVPLLPSPFVIDTLALMGEGIDGYFRLIHHYAFSR